MGAPLPLALPFALVDDHAIRIGCDSEAKHLLHGVVGGLDRRWLSAEHKRIQSEAKNQ